MKSRANAPRSSSTNRRKIARVFSGADDREFWERAEQRNATTARLYDALGLAEYEAIESFVRWDGKPLD